MHGCLDVPECVHAYFDVHDSLIIQHKLIFKGQKMVVPMLKDLRVMRKDLIEEIHSVHIGIEAYLTFTGHAWPQSSKTTLPSVMYALHIAAVKEKSLSSNTSLSLSHGQKFVRISVAYVEA